MLKINLEIIVRAAFLCCEAVNITALNVVTKGAVAVVVGFVAAGAEVLSAVTVSVSAMRAVVFCD